MIAFPARLMKKFGIRESGSTVMSTRTAVDLPCDRAEACTQRAARTAVRALCIPHQPVRAPTKFENFLVEPPKYPYPAAHVVRTAVIVPVEDLGPPVCRRIGQQCLDVGERIHDGFRRRLDHNFA